MGVTGLKNRAFLALLGIALSVVVLGVSTYAWFTNNNSVETGTATGKSGISEVVLLIGPDEGSLADSSNTEVTIAQVNDSNIEKLMPVSTSDLDTFMYCPYLENGKATKFIKDDEEKRLFHGRIFVELKGDGFTSEDRFRLYLDSSDSSGGEIVGSDSGHLLSAARLGFKVGDLDPIIIHFDDGDASAKDNTYIDGTELGPGYVLDSSGRPVNDPSEELAVYRLDSTNDTVEIPEKSLCTIPANEPVQIDVYFYIEGCDSNCTEDISTNDARLHIALYAMAE